MKLKLHSSNIPLNYFYISKSIVLNYSFISPHVMLFTNHLVIFYTNKFGNRNFLSHFAMLHDDLNCLVLGCHLKSSLQKIKCIQKFLVV